MDQCDALVVGGGPAGSSCAWALRRAGLDAVVLDRSQFPRDKVCAGWITPQIVEALEIDTRDYQQGRTFQPITGFRTSRLGPDSVGAALETRFDAPVSYGIRRTEFDHYLLDRSGARLRLGEPVATLRRQERQWIVNDVVRAPVLVGAGGHFCPVARFLNGPSRTEPIVAAQEIEARVTASGTAVAGDTPELFFCPDLRGYGWCFRKGNYLNVGFGRQDTHRFPAEARRFAATLRAMERLPSDLPDRWHGHAYLLHGTSPRAAVADGVMLVGDAAGLAYAQSGEGIRPAVESGLMAAQTILAAKGCYDRAHLDPYARQLTARFGASVVGRAVRRAMPAAASRAAARWLMGTPWFTRHLLLADGFLHTQQPALRLA